MKNALKTIFTILFLMGFAFEILGLVCSYSVNGLVPFIVATTIFLMHIFAWIAPRNFFNLCFRISNILPDGFDYDTSFKKLNLVDLGLSIASNVFLLLSLLLTYYV